MDPVAFDSFRAELKALLETVAALESRTVRSDELRDRFRMLFRSWTSSVRSGLAVSLVDTRQLHKLSAEVEQLARLTSKYKRAADYRLRLRRAIQLADEMVLVLPPSTEIQPNPIRTRHELFLTAISDLPMSMVPNPLVGWRARMEQFTLKHPFDKSVFIMVRYRPRTESLIRAVKNGLSACGLSGIVASEHRITDDLYNPIACLLCCAMGLALFDEGEQQQTFNPNVAYELGMLHLLGRRCLILKHSTLKILHTDILMKLYTTFSTEQDVAAITRSWFAADL